MRPLEILHDVRLVPVLELEPGRFSTGERPSPSGSSRELPDQWDRYWRASLADGGVVGLSPLRPGSWHVPATFADPKTRVPDPRPLGPILAATLESWGGVGSLTDSDAAPALDGGLALCEGRAVLAEPTCCVDLRNLYDWRGAAGYRGSEWSMLWIGHEWLSVRFDGGLLILSGPHESNSPVAQWAVTPEALAAAVVRAEAELEALAMMLEPVVAAFVGEEAARRVARNLAGFGG